ncbi:MAG TPA: hypothetical protein VNZ53_31970 [Steroidobacteraceae bacterium]|jgi:hypothetical protein|nr:hypothetical protein [Steroidobacteraceae bacterium]
MTERTDFLGALTKTLAKPSVQHLWYNEKSFSIDGYHFVECRFDKCTLYVNTGDFELTRCLIGPDTTVCFGGHLVNAIRLFNRVYPWAAEYFPLFVPTFESDGRISIHRPP